MSKTPPAKSTVATWEEELIQTWAKEKTFERSVEGRKGKLRIHLSGASASEVAALSRALWETVA